MTTLEAPAKPEEVQARARAAYLRSVDEGTPLTRQQLGEMFDRSESWARDRIAEARRPAGDGAPRRPATRTATPTVTPAATRVDTPVRSTATLAAAVTVTPTVTGNTDTPPAPTDIATAMSLSPAPGATVATPTVGDNGDMSPAPTVMSPDTVTPLSPDMSPVGEGDMLGDSGGDMTVRSQPGARLFAWFGFGFGSLVSIAANVLAAWLPAGSMPAGWAPSLASQVGAAVWPVALLVSVEVMSRVAWPRSWLWALVRFGGVAAVGLGSALISYGHIHDVLLSWGYDPLGAGVGPLVVDGLMVVSGFALLAMSGHDQD